MTPGTDTARADGPLWQVAIDHDSGVPPFEQLRATIAALIASGQLREGDRLPTVRTLAERAGVAVNTVAKAYRELSAEGLVVGHSRAGTVVASSSHSAVAALEQAAAAYAARAVSAGLSEQAAVDQIRAAYRAARA